MGELLILIVWFDLYVARKLAVSHTRQRNNSHPTQEILSFPRRQITSKLVLCERDLANISAHSSSIAFLSRSRYIKEDSSFRKRLAIISHPRLPIPLSAKQRRVNLEKHDSGIPSRPSSPILLLCRYKFFRLGSPPSSNERSLKPSGPRFAPLI